MGGPAYAATIEAGDGVSVNGNLYCTGKALREQAVLSHDGAARYTSEPKLGRFGGLQFAPGYTWQTLKSGALDQAAALLAAGPSLFVPNFPADMETHKVGMAEETITTAPSSDGVLYRVEKDRMLTLHAASADTLVNPAIFVILEENATLMIDGGGFFFVNVYGLGDLSDSSKSSKVKVSETAAICGTLQNVELDTSCDFLTMDNRQPTKLAFQAPSSAGRTKEGWAVVDYTQKPAA